METRGQETYSFDDLVTNNFTGKDLEEFNRIYYGRKNHVQVKVKELSIQAAKEADFDVAAYGFPAKKEHSRPPRVVKVGIVQHNHPAPTHLPIPEQRNIAHERMKKIIDVAGQEGVNIMCFQELWYMPYFFCTREKHPWCEFAESPTDGPTTRFLRELAVKYSMVICSPILERDENHADILWNTIVVISDSGNVIGKHRKNHIPRLGDYSECYYYVGGNTGHQVFQTRYGKIGFNICYGRHHVLNWLMLGLNGAEIVFNPSATMAAEQGSEYMWNIEARNAAITNCYYTAAVNRVGYEEFQSEFTSGEGQPAHKDLGLFYGSSYFCSPEGVRCPGLSRVKDGLLIAEMDLNLCRQMKDRRNYYTTQRLDMYVESLSKVADLEYKPPVVHEK